jgi:hypothetical protein
MLIRSVVVLQIVRIVLLHHSVAKQCLDQSAGANSVRKRYIAEDLSASLALQYPLSITFFQTATIDHHLSSCSSTQSLSG